jgi:hypothetical protein
MRSRSDLWRGIKSQPGKFGKHVFTSFSVVFTIVKGLTHFFPKLEFDGWVRLSIILVGCIIYAGNEAWKPSRIEFKVPTCDTCIEILFGDLFAQDGIRAIAVNEFFDSELGKPVSDLSLHGTFLKRCFGGHPQAFDAQLATELANVEHSHVQKAEGKQECYPIGTTALIKVNSDKYIVFAFAKTIPATCKAYSNVEYMWRSLHDLWDRARIETGGYPMNLPLVGSGLSGLGLPTRDLLNLLLLSAITETKGSQITSKIRFVLHESRFKDVDLRDVKKYWETL